MYSIECIEVQQRTSKKSWRKREESGEKENDHRTQVGRFIRLFLLDWPERNSQQRNLLLSDWTQPVCLARPSLQRTTSNKNFRFCGLFEETLDHLLCRRVLSRSSNRNQHNRTLMQTSHLCNSKFVIILWKFHSETHLTRLMDLGQVGYVIDSNIYRSEFSYR